MKLAKIAREHLARANARAWVRVRVPTRRRGLMDFRWDHVRVPTWVACRASRIAEFSRRWKFIATHVPLSGQQNGAATIASRIIQW